MSPKKTIENKKTSHKRDQPKMIKKEEEEDIRLPNKKDDHKQEDIISKDLNVRSSAHIDSKDSFEKSPKLLCIADYEISGDILDFQTLLANSTEDISKRMRPIVPIADEIDYIPIVTFNDDMFEAFLPTSNNTKEDTPNFSMVHTAFAKMFSKSKEPIAILIMSQPAHTPCVEFIPIISTNLRWGTATETHDPNLIRLSKVFPVNIDERTQACNTKDGVPFRVPFLSEVIAKIEQNPLWQIGVEKLVTESTINHTPPEARNIGTVVDSVKGGFGSLTKSLANIQISEASSHSLVVCHYAVMRKTP
ncbi:putative ribonuclease H protein [Senna tora]|uniref:Putative ribonuclease H protein n=1 Tax=Senna tora TaxID=362788 RepID=A0A834T5D9_9FABA|nr:putative ribonuclease H protein [Senna tora]